MTGSRLYERYIEVRKNLLQHVVFDISPIMIAFLSLAFAFMAAHFVAQGTLVLAGVMILLHGFMSMLTSEILAEHSSGMNTDFVITMLTRGAEAAIAVGIGLNPAFNAWVPLLLMAAFFLFHYARVHIKHLNGKDSWLIIGRGGFVTLLGLGAFLESIVQGSLRYALLLLTVIYLYYVITILFRGIASMQKEEGEA